MEELTFEQAHLLETLKEYHRGRRNAITAKMLQFRGWNPRELRRVVHDLRSMGHPICSGQDGYYYAENSGELADTLNFLGSYLREMQEVHQSVTETYNKMRYAEENS